MTVSNFINGKYQAMGVKTRQAIEREIKRLNYRPNTVARELRLAERLSIGLIIVDDSPTFLTHGGTSRIVAGLSNCLSTRGYSVALQGVTADQLRASALLRDRRTDGLCVVLSGPDEVRREMLDLLLATNEPLVLFQETLSAANDDVCVIRQDHREAGRLLGTHVLERGARKLIMLADERYHWPAIGAREAGIRAVIAACDHAATLEMVTCGDGGFVDTQRAVADWGDADAILAGSDEMAIAALRLMLDQGRAVPSEVCITGYNSVDLWHYSDPPLTTVVSRGYELGYRGGEEIIRRLREGSFSAKEIVLPVELQQGGTT